MSLLTLVVALVIVGVVLYFLPMDARVKQIIVAVVAIVALIYALRLLGLT